MLQLVHVVLQILHLPPRVSRVEIKRLGEVRVSLREPSYRTDTDTELSGNGLDVDHQNPERRLIFLCAFTHDLLLKHSTAYRLSGAAFFQPVYGSRSFDRARS